MSALYEIAYLVMFAGQTLQRSFGMQARKRQNADVIRFDYIGTKTKCAAYCIQRFNFCVGFNFRPGHPGRCELCRIPYDAPNADMVADPAWNHYAIIPWLVIIILSLSMLTKTPLVKIFFAIAK